MHGDNVVINHGGLVSYSPYCAGYACCCAAVLQSSQQLTHTHSCEDQGWPVHVAEMERCSPPACGFWGILDAQCAVYSAARVLLYFTSLLLSMLRQQWVHFAAAWCHCLLALARGLHLYFSCANGWEPLLPLVHAHSVYPLCRHFDWLASCVATCLYSTLFALWWRLQAAE